MKIIYISKADVNELKELMDMKYEYDSETGYKIIDILNMIDDDKNKIESFKSWNNRIGWSLKNDDENDIE